MGIVIVLDARLLVVSVLRISIGISSPSRHVPAPCGFPLSFPSLLLVSQQYIANSNHGHGIFAVPRRMRAPARPGNAHRRRPSRAIRVGSREQHDACARYRRGVRVGIPEGCACQVITGVDVTSVDDCMRMAEKLSGEAPVDI